MKQINTVSLVLAASFIIYKLLKAHYQPILLFIGLSAVFLFLSRNIYTSILLAILLAIGSDVMFINSQIKHEGFDGNAMGEGTRALLGEDAAPKVNKDNSQRKQNLNLDASYENTEDDELTNDLYMDAGTTFMKAYNSLSEDQVSAMRKDTQDLIETQKKLMQTLEVMKPVMSQGKEMLDSFKQYFGSEMPSAAAGPAA